MEYAEGKAHSFASGTSAIGAFFDGEVSHSGVICVRPEAGSGPASAGTLGSIVHAAQTQQKWMKVHFANAGIELGVSPPPPTQSCMGKEWVSFYGCVSDFWHEATVVFGFCALAFTARPGRSALCLCEEEEAVLESEQAFDLNGIFQVGP